MVLPREGRVEWFVRRGETLTSLEPGEQGFFRSEVFPGLWLDPAALLRSDTAGVLQALQLGVLRPEHRAFVKRLAEAAR